MKEKLTKKEIALMHQIRQEWIDRLICNIKPTSTKHVYKLVNWLYKTAGLKNPVILVLDSPLACQLGAEYAINLFEKLEVPINSDQVRAQVRKQVGQIRSQVCSRVWTKSSDQVRNQVNDQVRNQVAQVTSRIWDQVGGQVGGQVRAQVAQVALVSDQVWDQVWDQAALVSDQVALVSDQVRAQVWDQVKACGCYKDGAYRGNIGWDAYWLSFYEFLTQINVINSQQFNTFIKLMKDAMPFYMIQLKGLCVVSRMPTNIYRDTTNRLHNSESDYCIKFRDGWGFYALNGVRLPEKLYNRIVAEELTFKEVMEIDNAEQRMIALKYMNANELLEAVEAKLVDKSDRGNELWEVPAGEIFSRSERFVKLTCPSTGRVYLEGVTPANTDSADEAVAWQLFLTGKEYSQLKVET